MHTLPVGLFRPHQQILFRYIVQLAFYGLEIATQIKRSYAYAISHDLIFVIKCPLFICLRIEKHSGHLFMGNTDKLIFLCLHIGEYLVQVICRDGHLAKIAIQNSFKTIQHLNFIKQQIIHFFTYNFGTDISHKLFGVNSTLFLFNLNQAFANQIKIIG